MRRRRPRRFQSTAAADRPRMVTTYDMPKLRQYEEGPTRDPSFRVDVFAVSVAMGLFVGLAVGMLSPQDPLQNGVGVGAAVAAVMLCTRTFLIYDPMLLKGYIREELYQQLEEIDDDDEEEETDTSQENVVTIPIQGRHAVHFKQPRPGEFAAWVRQVLVDEANEDLLFNQQTVLSQNTGIDRGWHRETYQQMIEALRREGLVDIGRNRVFEPTEQGRAILARWLTTLHPPTP